MAVPVTLERLYDVHAQALFAFTLNILRDESDAHDVLQELFIKIARHPECLNGVRDERGFLLHLAHNLSIDLIRRRKTREQNCQEFASQPALFAESPDPDEQVYNRQLAAALGELPEEQRAVVHLKLWEGMTFEAVAKVLNISTNTAASRFRYGIDKMRDRLRPLYDEIK